MQNGSGSERKSLVTICDEGGVARKMYHVTTPTAVFVLDRAGVIKTIGTIEELEGPRRKAQSIAEEVEKRREQLYEEPGI